MGKITKKTATRNLDIRKFIIEYIRKNGATDVCDQEFHDEFHSRFGGTRKETNWGAQPVRLAMTWLKKLFDEGTLDRGTIRLGSNWQPGLPHWVYDYKLRGKGK